MTNRIVFYHWDWKSQPEVAPFQRAINAVFDGVHAPRMSDDFDANWDQHTVGISSLPATRRQLTEAFRRYLTVDDGMYWWDGKVPPTPFDVF